MATASLKKFLVIAVFAIFFILPENSYAQVVINELFSDPAGSNDTGKEWIKLFNSSSQETDLTGWQINGSGKYFTLPSLSLPPNSFLLIHWRADGQNTANEIFTSAAAIDTNIGNSSGFIALFKSGERNKDTIIDYVEYGKAGQSLEATAASAGIWPKEQFLPAPGENQTLRLKKDGQDSNSVNDWEIYNLPLLNNPNSTNANTNSNASPQQENQLGNEVLQEQADNASSSQPAINNFSDKILINEFLPWPSDGKEWIELTNTDSNTIDLSAWQIDDGPEGSASQKIPEGTLIEPNDLLVIELNKDILNNSGDQVQLLWPDGQIVHSVSYKNAKKGFSSARFEAGLWFWTNQPTPGQPNKKSTASMTQKAALPLPADPVALSEQVIEATAQNAPIVQEASQTNKTSSLNLFASPIAQQNDIPAANQPQKSASPPLALLLGIVTVLSLASGLGLAYFRHKKSIDNK
ncbi:MAG: lamin tail domain-containing protein [bacterium]